MGVDFGLGVWWASGLGVWWLYYGWWVLAGFGDLLWGWYNIHFRGLHLCFDACYGYAVGVFWGLSFSLWIWPDLVLVCFWGIMLFMVLVVLRFWVCSVVLLACLVGLVVSWGLM